MSDVTKILIVGHSDPVIHGQSMQFTRLLEAAQRWENVQTDTVNAVYASTRGKLTGFSIMKMGRMLRYVWRMCRIALKNKSEIVILSAAFHRGPFLKDSIFIILAKLLCGAKVIAWVHMDPNRMNFDIQPSCFQKYVRWAMSHVDLMVACAPSLSEQWPEFLSNIPAISVANGVKDESYKNGELKKKNNRVRIGYLSAMDDEKGWRSLYNVAIKLCEKYKDVEFYFYGEVGFGETEEELKCFFEGNPFGPRIQWLGSTWGDKKNKAYEEMNLFCLPSHTEAFPLTVLEAMSFSLPVVATDVGAVKDALKEKQGGWVCIPNDVKALYDSLSDALDRREEWSKMGQFNRGMYLTHFSLEAFSKSWREVVGDVA